MVVRGRMTSRIEVRQILCLFIGQPLEGRIVGAVGRGQLTVPMQHRGWIPKRKS